METPFLGGTYESLSPNLADDRCINLYPEIVETKQGKKIVGFYSTPGQKFLQTLSASGAGAVSGPLRGSRSCSTGQLAAVFGNQVVLITQNGVVTHIGKLNTASGPVSIIDNGRQYAVFDNFQGWSYSSGTWAQITTIPSFPGIACMQDGFGVVGIVGTNQFYQSNLNDLTIWDALNFSSADSEPSNIQAIVSIFRQLWVVKQNSIEIWNNAGLNGFVFQRMQGAFINVGCSAPYSVAINEDHVFWLGLSDRGSLVVYINNGYAEQRISTHAIDYALNKYQSLSSIGVADAIGFCYTQGGHTFYVLSFPSGNATWAYDLTTGWWHERAEFLNGNYHRWDPSCYAYFNKQHIVGSSTAPQLSVLDILYPTDDLAITPPSNPKRYMRRWRALKNAINMPVRFGSLKIDMQTGAPLGTGFYPDIANVIVSGKLGNHFSGVPVSYSYAASGSFPPYTFSIVSGSLPSGLSISSSGQVTGTPTTAGSYEWTVEAVDKLGNVGTLEDSSIISAYTYWLTAGDNNVYVSSSLTNWSSAQLYQRSPYVNLDNFFYTPGYLQLSDGSIIGSTPGNPVQTEHVTATIPGGTIPTVVLNVDSNGTPVRVRYYKGIVFIFVPNELYYYASGDNGKSFTQYPYPAGSGVSDIGLTPNGNLVIEDAGTATPFYYSSSNSLPLVWQAATAPTGTSNAIACICSSNNGCFKIGTLGRVASTVNGETWNVSAGGVYPDSYLAYVYASDGTNVMIGGTSGGNVWLTSNNGTSFGASPILVTSGTYIVDIKYLNGSFMVSDSNSNIYVSSNAGTSWTTITQPSGASSMTGHRTISQVIVS